MTEKETVKVEELDFESAFEVIETIRDSTVVDEKEREYFNNVHAFLQEFEDYEEFEIEEY